MKYSNRTGGSRSWLLIGSLALAAAPLGAALADEQTVPAETSSAGEHSPGLQEVTVTATRREESLSKVPISVTALTQDSMDQLGIKDFQDVARFTPGVNIDTSGTNAISIRGISSSGGAGTTGIYIDDTPIQMRSLGFNPDDTLPKTFDLQRVEVLRGPQGTLFGAGAEGGAVRYILTQPSTTTADTYIRSELSYTQYGQPSGEAGIARGQPIIDGTLGVRASIWYRYSGGWIDRVDDSTDAVINHNVNYSNTVVGRVALLWTPTDAVSITPSLLYQRQDTHDDSTYWPAYSNPGNGQFNTATPERVGGPDRYYIGALKLQWDLGKTQLIANASYFDRKQITAYQGTVYDLSYWQTIPSNFYDANGNELPTPPKCSADQDATSCSWFPLIDANGIHLPAALAGLQTPNTMTNSQQSYTGEVRLQSNDASSRWTWTAGVFWQLAKEGSIEELKSNNIDQVFNYLYGITPAQYYGDQYYSCPTNAAYPSIPACDIYYNNNTTFDRQIAAYGEVGFAITDWMKLTVGERVAHTTFSLNHYADGYENYGPGPAQANQKETPNTPKATLSFQVDPKDLYYISYAKGFRVGGGNAPLPSYCDDDLAAAGYANGAPLTYKSDSTQNYEIGSKNAFGDWLKIATSVYYIKWNDIQQSIYVAGACGLQFTDNLGTAAAWGGDIQAEAKLGAFDIDLATGYTSARYTKDDPAGCQVSATSAPCLATKGDAISGQAAINYSPGTNAPFTVALGVQYNYHLMTHDAFVRADWEYEARNPWLAAVQDPNNNAQYNYGYSYTLPSTSFTSVRAGVSLGGDWQLAAFCDNLFDTHTVTNYALGQTDGTYTPQQNAYTFRPRTVGITATWRGH
ncbi:MAG TPA: TonB-dependent receptor [Steroidobacteraceae bacterium]|nr:TonB-dependent receptor [Steroidobacteraceae bacterium]